MQNGSKDYANLAIEVIGNSINFDNNRNNLAVIKGKTENIADKFFENIGIENHVTIQNTLKAAMDTAIMAGMFSPDTVLTGNGKQKKNKSEKQNVVRLFSRAFVRAQKKAKIDEAKLLQFKGISFQLVPVKIKAKPSFKQAIESLFDSYGMPYDADTYKTIETAITDCKKRLQQRAKQAKKAAESFIMLQTAEKYRSIAESLSLVWDIKTVQSIAKMHGKNLSEQTAKKYHLAGI